MLVMIQNERYMIDGEILTFKGERNNGERILFDKENGNRIEIELEDLIEKDIKEIMMNLY